MKKVLILAYAFPPYVSAGSLRPHSWYKYLHESGIYPIVVTRQWGNRYRNHLDYVAPGQVPHAVVEESDRGTIIRTPYAPNLSNRLLLKYGSSTFRYPRKLISLFYEVAQFCFFVGAQTQLYFAAREYLARHPVDCIIATSEPFVLFRYAALLSKAFHTPWIADYRDPWSNDVSRSRFSPLSAWNAYLERRIVREADHVTTVSKFFEVYIRRVISAKPIAMIANGYDPEAMEDARRVEQNRDIFTIACAGTIYDWHPLRSVLAVVSEFVAKNDGARLKLEFYGINVESDVRQMIETDFPNLHPVVAIHGKIPHEAVLRELARSNALLLFNQYSHMGTKIYEYIGLERTILFCYTDDEEAAKLKAKHYPIAPVEGTSPHIQVDVLTETNAGYVVRDARHLYEVLVALHGQFEQQRYLRCETKGSERYSRRSQTERLAELIEAVTTVTAPRASV